MADQRLQHGFSCADHPAVLARLEKEYAGGFHALTTRELEQLEPMAVGRTLGQIAVDQQVSVSAIRKLRVSCQGKLGAQSPEQVGYMGLYKRRISFATVSLPYRPLTSAESDVLSLMALGFSFVETEALLGGTAARARAGLAGNWHVSTGALVIRAFENRYWSPEPV